MNLNQYVERLQSELHVAAQAGNEESRKLAERLTGPLDSATRLVLLEALSAAANEITREMAPGSVDVRLRGLDPEFVVTTRQVHEDDENVAGLQLATRLPGQEADEAATSRITLRLPEHLKQLVEEAASREGLSVNAWLVRAIAASVEPGDRERRPRRRGPPGGQRYTGWVH